MLRIDLLNEIRNKDESGKTLAFQRLLLHRTSPNCLQDETKLFPCTAFYDSCYVREVDL